MVVVVVVVAAAAVAAADVAVVEDIGQVRLVSVGSLDLVVLVVGSLRTGFALGDYVVPVVAVDWVGPFAAAFHTDFAVDPEVPVVLVVAVAVAVARLADLHKAAFDLVDPFRTEVDPLAVAFGQDLRDNPDEDRRGTHQVAEDGLPSQVAPHTDPMSRTTAAVGLVLLDFGSRKFLPMQSWLVRAVLSRKQIFENEI